MTSLTACSGVGSSKPLTDFQKGGLATRPPTVLPAPVATLQDGSSGAPAGSPQFPNFFQASGYLARPSWFVAGVDYAVGIPAGTTLKDPSTISMAGVTVDTTTHVISVDAANITLDSYDFSTDGGWEVRIGSAAPADSTRIVNSRFKVGANGLPPVFGTPGASNLYVGFCIFDGNSTSDGFNGTAITMDGPKLTVEYNWILNNYGGGIDDGGGDTVTVQFNVFDNLGQGTQMNPFWLQLGGGNYTVTAIYNFGYQPAATVGQGSNGLQVVADTGTPSTIVSAEVGHNSLIALAGAKMQFAVSVDPTQVTGTSSVDNNYADISGSKAFATAGSSGGNSSFSANTNLVTGLAFPNNP